jgi:signal transduction histidine kinase
MAMQRSEELAETAADFFIQLNYLGIKPYRFNIAIVDEQDDKCQLWSTTNEGKVIPTGTFIPLTENDVFNQMYEGWKKQQNSIIKITGEKRIRWTEYIMKYLSFTEYRPENIDIEKLKSEAAIFSNFNFKQGFFVIHTTEDIDNNDLKILQRFANVFEQTYTRFLDLKQAEAQAKEAVKQASLDRVRAEIASMRTAEDLNRITPLIWRELTNLEVPFIRCGVFIVDEEQENVRVYLTTPDGKALGVLNLPFGSNDLTNNTVAAWQKNKIYKDHWNKEEFISWTKSMMQLGQVQNAETYQGSSSPPESLHLHFVPFSQGMLYVGDTSPLSEDKLDLVRTLAESFSIAYARYEDFRNLEAAKNKIELTLSELRSAQAQLIHSEKMASLGELTAGIAHEIKNPLNFVNNFSEISGELLSELKEEIEKNDREEVLTLLEDLKQNLEKINLHGKRADSIVKGMLLHSRGTAGEKTLTDINDLLDQYVNLGYHGMRAQNKEFNITIEKDYDDTIGKINVVPQDISRVFLNLINNACYAAYDRKKNNSDNNFSPALKVSTKKLNDKVEIRIGDNGSGIPKDILGKIFQPFFTTKPTGEGTGLGLSLSYDIVTKVHGGTLSVETKEGKGSEFIIQLRLD